MKAYPLAWPEGWPRQTCREHSRFKTTLSSALNGLKDEIRLMGGTNLILSSNCTLGHENPADPGVVAFFTWDKAQLAIPCDRWTKVSDNVQAIRMTVQAMRGMERWGAKHMIKSMFTGFKALPEKFGEVRDLFEILEAPRSTDFSAIHALYRAAAMRLHPDRGGDKEKFIELQKAWEVYRGTVK